MPRIVDLSGQRFGKLTVLNEYKKRKSRIHWLCICDCGKKAWIQSSNMKRGLVKSCGCIRGENHGKSKTKTYNTWLKMKERCNNKNCPEYGYYGAKGIKVCERWNTFSNFLEDMGEKPNGKSIDRIDNTKGYEPNNCRWATQLEQARNKTTTIRVEYDGITKTIQEWSDALGIKYATLYKALVINGKTLNEYLSQKSQLQPHCP